MLINTGVTSNLEIILVHIVMFAKQDLKQGRNREWSEHNLGCTPNIFFPLVLCHKCLWTWMQNQAINSLWNSSGNKAKAC